MTSPASRRTWPRSCEAITILDAGLRRHQHDLLDAARRGGSRLAVGSSSSNIFRIARQRPRQRQPLLFAAREPPRRRCARSESPTRSSNAATRCARSLRGRAGLRQRIGDVGSRGPSQHHWALKQDRAAQGRAISPAAPGDAAGRRRRKSHAESQQVGLARAIRPDDERRRARVIVRLKRLRIAVAPACSETSSRTRGRSLIGARIVSPPAALTRRASPTRLR